MLSFKTDSNNTQKKHKDQILSHAERRRREERRGETSGPTGDKNPMRCSYKHGQFYKLSVVCLWVRAGGKSI